MIFISYYTKNTPYEKIAHTKIIPTLKKWKLKYDIEAIKDLGSWQKNTHYKAECIKKMLLKYKEPIVFIDVDATIEQYPNLFEKLEHFKFDISYHTLDWMLQWRGHPGNKKEILSGTLYLDYNPKVLKFVNEWIKENNKSTKWEQKNMATVLKRTYNLKTYPLPPEYITIILFNGEVPKHIKEPVIIHWQASRKHKK